MHSQRVQNASELQRTRRKKNAEVLVTMPRTQSMRSCISFLGGGGGGVGWMFSQR